MRKARADSVKIEAGRVVGLILLGGALACGKADGGGDGSGADSETVSDSSRVPDGDSSAAPDDPFGGFELPGDSGAGDMRKFRLRLRNDGDGIAIVFADGGAGEVLVDSVPAGSWRPVDIESRARFVRLRSVDAAGDPLREIDLGQPADTAVDVAVGLRLAP